MLSTSKHEILSAVKRIQKGELKRVLKSGRQGELVRFRFFLKKKSGGSRGGAAIPAGAVGGGRSPPMSSCKIPKKPLKSPLRRFERAEGDLMRFRFFEKKNGGSRGDAAPPAGGVGGRGGVSPPCHCVRFQKSLKLPLSTLNLPLSLPPAPLSPS